MSIITEVTSIKTEYLSAIWHIIEAQALQWISQKYIIVLQMNAQVCSMHRILWRLRYIEDEEKNSEQSYEFSVFFLI